MKKPALKEAVAGVLGKVISGTYVTTVNADGKPMGMLTTFIEQAGFEPPVITIAVGKTRPILQYLEAGNLFGVNILGKSNQELLKSFVRHDLGDAFARHELMQNENGVPQFKEAWGFLLCRAGERLTTKDHVVILGEIIGGELHKSAEEPMVRVRSNGFSY